MEEREWLVSHVAGEVTLIERGRGTCGALPVGAVFDLWTGSQWQRVTFQSGGYRGRYVEQADG